MNEHRYQQVSDLFAAVYEMEPQLQASYLDDACGDDHQLRAEVEDLLERHAETSPFMHSPLMGSRFGVAEDAAAPAPDASLVGERIGAYTVQRLLASGGMGTVYEAVQEHPHRTVALKVMRRSIASPSGARRFEYESEILGRLRHECIAQIYEAGMWEENGAHVPFFAMEYVPDGMPLTEYARAKLFSTRQRLDLFIKVCEAVHHGHQKGIIHRDLKPANLLVDAAGHPKVIDFGVARATDADLAATTMQTGVGQLVGTLQYMSPEQCAADAHDLDTRSDVYALGVIMYELLCEQLPYDVSQSTLPEALRVIRDDPPSRPSTIRRVLRGDLETILLKALEKDRDRRYQSAGDLAEDIRRYLHSEPITARPPSALYQIRKFAVRHRALSGAAAAVMFVLVIGVITTSAQAVRATKAEKTSLKNEQEAETEAARATAVVDLIMQMLGSADPDELRGRNYTVRQLLDEFALGLDRQLEGQPEIEATIRMIIGIAYRKLGELDAAERHLTSALEISRKVYGQNHAATADALVEWGFLLHQRADYEAAERSLRDAFETRCRLSGAESVAAATTLSSIADMLRHQERYAEAEKLARRSLTTLLATVGEEDEDTCHAMDLLAGVCADLGRYDEAERLQRDALRNSVRLHGDDHLHNLRFAHNLAVVLDAQGSIEEAERLFRDVLERSVHFLGDDHLDTLNERACLGALLFYEGRPAEAEPYLAAALEGRRHALEDEHPYTLKSMRMLGNLYRKLNRDDESEPLLAAAVDGMRKVHGADDPRTYRAMSDLAHVYGKLERYREAEELIRPALAGMRRVPGYDDVSTAVTVARLARLASHQGRHEEAASLYAEALEMHVRASGEDDVETLTTKFKLGEAYVDLQRFEQALAVYLEVVEEHRRVLGADHPQTLESLMRVGWLNWRLERFDDALDAFTELLAIHRDTLGERHPATLQTLFNLAAQYQSVGRYAEAAPLFLQWADGFRASPPVGPSQVTASWFYQAAVCLVWSGDVASAAELLRESLAIAREVGTEQTPDGAQTRNDLAKALLELAEFEEAEQLAREALAIFRDEGGDEDRRTAEAMRALGLALLGQGQPESAEPLLRRSVEIYHWLEGVEPWRVARAESSLGQCLVALRRYDEAEALLLESYETIRAAKGDDFFETRLARRRIDELYQAWGIAEEPRDEGVVPNR